MKTLLHITRLSFILILLASLNACKKDKSDGPDGGGSGSYTYLGASTGTTRADYLMADNNVYLYVYGKGAVDIVQLIFDKAGAAIPEGVFTFKSSAVLGYDAKKNFSGGSVTTAAHPEGTLINGGTVTVAKNGDGYDVAFDCTTAGGSLKGNYTGTFTSR